MLGRVHRGPDLFPSLSDRMVRKTRVLSSRSSDLTSPVASASVSRGAGVNGSMAIIEIQ